MNKIILAAIASAAFATSAFAMEPANSPQSVNAGTSGSVMMPAEGVDMNTTASIRTTAPAADASDDANQPALEYGPTVDKFDLYTGK